MTLNDVTTVPAPFYQYTGYNETKRKKIKSNPLSSALLNTHAETLLSLLTKPYMNTSPAWKEMAESLKMLANCFISYKKYLDDKANESERNKNSEHPVRTVDKHATIEHRDKVSFVNPKYSGIEKAVKEAGEMQPVIFYENVHLDIPFSTRQQRYELVKSLKLSVPVDIIRYCPGGSVITTMAIVQVAPNRNEAQLLTQGATMVQQLKPHLKEFHTRAQKEHLNQN